MQRRSFRIMTTAVAATGVLALGACAPEGATGGDDTVYTYRIASIEGIGTPVNNALDMLVEEVAECSDGRLVGENFPAGQLGAHVDLIDGNREGVYEIVTGGFDAEAGVAPGVAALALGYIFKDDDHAERVIAEMQDEISAALEETTGVSIIAMGQDGWRWTYSTRQISNINDLDGLKMRVPEFEIPIGVWSALGASPTPVPFTEIYNALETGVIDAGEGSLPQIRANAFWEPAPYLVNAKHWYLFKPVRVNTEWLESLPADLRTCLEDTAKRLFDESREIDREIAASILEELEGEGVTVTEVPTDIELWEERARVFTEEYIAKYPEAGPILERVAELAEG